MSPTVESLGIDRLTVAEKLDLIGQIWDGMVAEIEKAPLSDTQKREVDSRLAAHDANPSAAIPWGEAKAQILARLRK